MMNFKELQEKVYELGELISAPKSILKIHATSQWDGSPYIYFSDDGHYYIYEEKGVIWKREGPMDDDSILYKIFEGVIASIAGEYELNNRVDGCDFRRLYFKKQIELMDKIKGDWSKRRQAYFDAVLEDSPFDDCH